MMKLIKPKSLDEVERAADKYGSVLVINPQFKVRVVSNPEHKKKPKKKVAKA